MKEIQAPSPKSAFNAKNGVAGDLRLGALLALSSAFACIECGNSMAYLSVTSPSRGGSLDDHSSGSSRHRPELVAPVVSDPELVVPVVSDPELVALVVSDPELVAVALREPSTTTSPWYPLWLLARQPMARFPLMEPDSTLGPSTTSSDHSLQNQAHHLLVV